LWLFFVCFFGNLDVNLVCANVRSGLWWILPSLSCSYLL
jgi:hypothetical protein